MENEEIKNEVVVSDTETENYLLVKDFNEMSKRRNANMQVFTSIKDAKKIFNLENSVDYKLNDCKGELIRVKDVLIKVIEKPLEEPIVDEATGEVIQDKEYKKICILIDNEGKSYVTASKMFTNQFMSYISMFGIDGIVKDGLDIKIIERSVKNSNNKALGFELA